MAKLFMKQAEEYSVGRPSYPHQLFDFIASKTPSHNLAWDVGTGNGQAAQSLASIYTNVVATDTSPKQLELATKRPNITYKCTSPGMSLSELHSTIGPESCLDLVTVAQAMHWFDLPEFYHHAKRVLKKPDGVLAAWCYTTPEFNPRVDSVFQRYYTDRVGPYWDPARRLIDNRYETIDFPFEPVDGLEHTGPYRFNSEKVMDLEGYFTYLRSWSAYQTAKETGVELLSDAVVEDFTRAWNEDERNEKVATFPVYLRIGKIGPQN